MMRSPVLAIVLIAAAHAVTQQTKETPVTKVVELINEMKAKIESDGKAEQKVYDKFACWCEKTTARKAGAIEDAKVSIEDLSQLVLQLKGKTATLKAEIAQLEKDIGGNIDGTKEATSIRERETADYDQQRSDLEAAIGALERAVKILTGAGEFTQKSASAIQQAEILSVAGGLRGALRLAPVGDEFGAISEKDKAAVEAFVRNPEPYVKAKFSGIQQKNPNGDYAPQSGMIQGILKGMYDAFTADLESKNADQALRQKTYEELTATKDSELNTLKNTLAKKKETLGDDTKTMTDSSIERDETQAQLKADEKFFEDTKVSCKNQADAWAERSRLRTEELAGINKAVEILTSDEAAATFSRSTSMFMQTSQVSTTANAKKHAAFMAVKTVARRNHSLRLAALAAFIQTSTEGHFNAVISTIDKQLGDLRTEEQDDIDLKDYCAAEEDKTANEIEDLQHKMTNIQGLIDRLNSKKKELQADIVKTEGDITDTENAMAEALSTRNSEHEDFKAALKDDMDAVALLAQAIDALTAFSKNNKLPLGLVQKKHKKHRKHSSHKHSVHAKQPEYSVDEDKAPETFSDGGYGGKSSEGGGIVSIIGYIKEDLENEIATTKKAEARAQADYAEQRKAALEALAALKTKKNNLETQEAETDEKITDATEDKETHNTMKGQKEDYKDSLKPRCEWIKGAFDTRASKRNDEIEGLSQAKSSLAGATGFLQK
jgi:predicted  nucleic acid-binding Zn-ribbon protein